MGARHEGPDAVRRAFAAAWQNFPDAQWRNGRHWVCGEHGVSESTFTGTAADGSRVEADMVDVFTFKNGKIQVKNAYRKQRPALPARALRRPPPRYRREPKHGRSHGCADECPHGRFDAGPRRPRPYDPAYDPLVSPPGQGQDYAPTYWVATAGSPPQDDGPVNGDMEVDVAVVGSGFTGLSAALTLARDYGVRAVVLEANRAVRLHQPQRRPGPERLGKAVPLAVDPALGLDTARRLDAEIREGFEYWKSLVAQVDCDAQPGGHLYTAHRQKKMAFLENESRVMREVFGYDTRMLSKDQLRERYVDDHEAVARCWSRTAWACIRSLAYGYLRQARAGREHPSVQPGAGWRAQNGAYLLQTPAARCARGAWPSPPAATRRRA